MVSSFSIFDPRKVPATSSPLFSLYGEGAIDTLIDHYAQDFLIENVHGVQFVKDLTRCLHRVENVSLTSV